jgi:hypothetical protein
MPDTTRQAPSSGGCVILCVTRSHAAPGGVMICDYYYYYYCQRHQRDADHAAVITSLPRALPPPPAPAVMGVRNSCSCSGASNQREPDPSMYSAPVSVCKLPYFSYFYFLLLRAGSGMMHCAHLPMFPLHEALQPAAGSRTHSCRQPPGLGGSSL